MVKPLSNQYLESLPETMTALEPGSWANITVTRRWPQIARRIFDENELSCQSQQRLENLILEIPDSTSRRINAPDSPDYEVWNNAVVSHLDKNWLAPPWFFTEHYFYRRVIESIGYFHFKEGQRFDPFAYQKRQGLALNRDTIRNLAGRVSDWGRQYDHLEPLIHMLYLDLWGNQSDLSMWPAEEGEKPNHDDLDHAKAFLLEDRATDAADYLIKSCHDPRSLGDSRVDFIIDNAGFELISDLVFTDYLLTSGFATTVRFHLKPHPTYVSDAMVKDVLESLTFLKSDSDPLVQTLGTRLEGYWLEGRLQLKDNFFWTSPLPGWEIPSPLAHELSQANLVISKGDANYRRLLGDRDWPYTTPFVDILSYFPTSLVALRTVKAEIACGLNPGQAKRVADADPEWKTNGRWGLIQFFKAGDKQD